MLVAWAEQPISAIATVVKGRKPAALGDAVDGHEYLTAEALRSGVGTQWVESIRDMVLAEPGDALLLWDGAGAGDVFSARRGVVASTMARVRPLDAKQLLPQFLAYALEMKVPEIRNGRRGTTVPHVDSRAFASLAIHVPPLDVQMRIVDLLSAADRSVAAAMRVTETARLRALALMDELAHSVSAASTTSLGALAAVKSGPSWSASDESTQPREGAVPVVKITNTKPDGSLDSRELVYVSGLSESVERLDECSLILIRTNGNRSRIGNAYRPTPAVLGAAVSAFQFSAKFGSVPDRDWVFWWLCQPRVQGQMSLAASGTTGLGNLSAKWLKELPIPWPEPEERAKWVGILDAAKDFGNTLASEADSIGKLRKALVENLVQGRLAIPAVYDSLVEGAS